MFIYTDLFYTNGENEKTINLPGRKQMTKHLILIIVLFLLLSSPFIGVSSSLGDRTSVKQTDYRLPEFYNSYSRSERTWYLNSLLHQQTMKIKYDTYVSDRINEQNIGLSEGDGGLMNSSWPMQSHDVQHSGRSPYSTTKNFGAEIWNYPTGGPTGSMSIDNDGSIYIGADGIYALNSNGTLKWKYITYLIVESAPAIDENGIIYFGTTWGDPDYFYALYPDGTLKWEFPCGSVFCSPVITADGTIIFADSDNSRIYALNPNGTEKWVFHANMVIYSSPAIGLDGTIFCGSHDHNIYALYPNNGTLKWKFTTEDWVHGSPTIGVDGTVYIGSDDGYLYALYQNNGTMKWKCHIGACYANPALDKNGILYIGVWEKEFYAIYPNGTIKWSFNPGAKIWGSSAAISDDGTIYFGTCDLESSGGIEIIALSINGTIKWRKNLDTTFSSPAIGEDGTVYIGSNTMSGGYIRAYGYCPVRAEANGPYSGEATITIQFTGTIFGGVPPYTCQWDFGDGQTSQDENPTHLYTHEGLYSATFSVTDNEGNTSTDSASVIVHYAPPTINVIKPIFGVYFMNIRILPFKGNVLAIGPLTFRVEAHEEPFGINRVEFLIDGEVKATDTEPPYTYTWRSLSFAVHNFDIIAYDNSGNFTDHWMNVVKFF
jgi:outer membrane protein assembly factor BamB